MKEAGKLAIAAVILFLLGLPTPSALGADNSNAAKLQQVLQQLDASARNFHSASADFEFQNVQTEPVPDVDVMTGTVYFEHRGGAVRMAAHVKQRNGHPYESTYTYSSGMFQLYNKQLNQVTKYQTSANLAGYLSLGFGASGKELQNDYQISWLGQETIDGVKTEKLQLIPKDQKARNLFPKIVIWIDPTRDVNLKQVFDEGQGLSRVCAYSNIRMNRSIPSSEFSFKTNKNTKFNTQ